ncbi:MAG TPA: DUF2269 domain-containing protein [Polyangiaceae bacterium]
MSGYVFMLVKTVHVLAAVLFLGFGLASFFYKSLAFRARSPEIALWCDRQIVLADWIFTIPSGLALPATGALLVGLYHLPWTTGWVLTGLAGYAIAGLTWLPAARLQLVMCRLSEHSVATGTPLPPEYGSALRTWRLLGVPSFLGTMLALWAMVSKWSP